MTYRLLFFGFAMLVLVSSCKADKPVEQQKPAPAVILKPKPLLLSSEQRRELNFSADIIESVERAAGVRAEPFFSTVALQSENLKGGTGLEGKKLAGFSVRTTGSGDLIDSLRSPLRAKGYLIFKSQKGYGSLPDIVSVVRGSNSYDILKIQGTESVGHRLDTKTIIAWLKMQQKEASFSITGAGSDWVEARFINRPKDMSAFAKKVGEFAPDVLAHDTRTVEKLAEWMKKTNGFYLNWD